MNYNEDKDKKEMEKMTIKIPVDNAQEMARQHSFLKEMHDRMAKASFDQMKEHIMAAEYHSKQYDTLEKAVKDVTYMMTETKTSVGGSDTGSTGEPASTAPRATEPKDDAMVETVKKSNQYSDLVNILKEHEVEFGKFDVDVELIANFLMTK
jgi:hypothetical protein